MRLRFDRGTIVLHDPPPGLDVARLPSVLWDPRVRSFRAPAAVRSSLLTALAAHGVAVDDRTLRPAPVDDWRAVELRPYQEAALSAWQAAGGRGTVVLPTGSGKTRVALAAMARARTSALCLVPTRVLLDQWHRELGRCYGGPVGYYGNGVRRLEAVTVCTYASAERHMARLGDRFELVIADEVHNVAGGGYRDAFEMMAAPWRLGLTATPPAAGDALAVLAAAVGPCVYELSIGDLTGGFLAPFDRVTLLLDLGPDERRRYEQDRDLFRRTYARFRMAWPGAEWSDFTRAASRSPDGRGALAAWRRARRLLTFTAAKGQAVDLLLARHADAKVLVFTGDNDSAYAIARRNLVMPITCDIGRAERDLALERFRRGELRALVSSRVLNEGLDVPDAEVAIVAGGSLGAREHVQRVGRLLRPGPGKRALVYELVSRETTEIRQLEQRSSSLDARVSAQL